MVKRHGKIDVNLKRAYLPPSPQDGYRVLVDRIWPRGLRKKKARIDLWLKDVAPSTALRKWFGHDPARWREFRRRYQAELARQATPLEKLRAMARKGRLTLIFGARDERHNQAVVLKDLLARQRSTRSRRGAPARRRAAPSA
ncbi:MAG: DUF488 domain-containing protein [Alphaproteobacteria bacterium]|nr:DUF488 domain-containing protein [Alphaproteobacteria bacterium]